MLLCCFQVVRLLSCLHNQIERFWRSRDMFSYCFLTIAASNCVLSSRETSVNPCKVEWNWLRSLGHSWPRARTESTKYVGSHWQWPHISFLHPSTLLLPPLQAPQLLALPKGIFIFAKILGFSHLYCLLFFFMPNLGIKRYFVSN